MGRFYGFPAIQMTALEVLLKGMLFGASVAAPVGPMAMLCINRVLARGLASGLAVGMGIATGDALYGAVAGLGFSAITSVLVAHVQMLRLVGIVFLIWLALKAWRSAGQTHAARTNGNSIGLAKDYGVAVGLTLTNPATILSFIAVFAALGMASAQGAVGVLVAGVFLGSAVWWIVLCSVVALVRSALTVSVMRVIDRISAGFLLVLALGAAFGLRLR